MSDLIKIRHQLKPGDIGYITYMHGKLYAQVYDWDCSFDAYVAGPLSEFLLSENPGQRLWVVEEKGTIKGSIALVHVNSKTAQLRWFLIDPSVRGKGLGKTLMQTLLDFARQHHYQKIILWTVKDLEPAASLYNKFGFRITEEKVSHLWGSVETEQKYELVFND